MYAYGGGFATRCTPKWEIIEQQPANFPYRSAQPRSSIVTQLGEVFFGVFDGYLYKASKFEIIPFRMANNAKEVAVFRNVLLVREGSDIVTMEGETVSFQS